MAGVHQAVGVRGTGAGQAGLRAQVTEVRAPCGRRCVERQKRRHRPVQWSCSGHVDAAGGHRGLRGHLGPGSVHHPAPQLPCGAANKDVMAAGVQHPVVPLARVVVVTRHLDEALVEAEVVPDGVLPTRPVVAVVGEVVHDEVVDAAEGEAPLGALADRHHNERIVTEGGLLRLTFWLSSLLVFSFLHHLCFSTLPTLFLIHTLGSSLHFRALLRWFSASPSHRRRRSGRSGLLTHHLLSSPQQTADAERGGLVEKAHRCFSILHLHR